MSKTHPTAAEIEKAIAESELFEKTADGLWAEKDLRLEQEFAD